MEDKEGKEIIKGFYLYNNSNQLAYFNGEYNEEGRAMIDIEGETCNFSSVSAKHLRRLDKEEIETLSKRLKKQSSWLEKRLRE